MCALCGLRNQRELWLSQYAYAVMGNVPVGVFFLKNVSSLSAAVVRSHVLLTRELVKQQYVFFRGPVN
jgi:hypothetical protein